MYTAVMDRAVVPMVIAAGDEYEARPLLRDDVDDRPDATDADTVVVLGARREALGRRCHRKPVFEVDLPPKVESERTWLRATSDCCVVRCRCRRPNAPGVASRSPRDGAGDQRAWSGHGRRRCHRGGRPFLAGHGLGDLRVARSARRGRDDGISHGATEHECVPASRRVARLEPAPAESARAHAEASLW